MIPLPLIFVISECAHCYKGFLSTTGRPSMLPMNSQATDLRFQFKNVHPAHLIQGRTQTSAVLHIDLWLPGGIVLAATGCHKVQSNQSHKLSCSALSSQKLHQETKALYRIVWKKKIATIKALCDLDTYVLIVCQLSTISLYQCYKENKFLSLYVHPAMRSSTDKLWVPQSLCRKRGKGGRCIQKLRVPLSVRQ